MILKNKLTLATVLFLGACGTIFSGSVQNINFNSNVKDVKIYANGALVCSSMPCRVDIDRGSAALTIIAKADGYEDNITQIKTKINPASWGNLISAYSWTTDFATSSMWKYTQDGIYINMEPKNLKKAEAVQFKQDSQVRYFSLINYPELKIEAASNGTSEYVESLATLSNTNSAKLKTIINNSRDEVALAHKLTGLE